MKKKAIDIYDDSHIDPSDDNKLETLSELKIKAAKHKLKKKTKKADSDS